MLTSSQWRQSITDIGATAKLGMNLEREPCPYFKKIVDFLVTKWRSGALLRIALNALNLASPSVQATD